MIEMAFGRVDGPVLLWCTEESAKNKECEGGS